VGSPVEPAPATVAPAVLSAVGTPAALLNFPLENQPLVGIIDTGFAANNPDIDYSKIILGRDYVGSDANPLLQPGEGNEHGTYVLGVIAAKQNNGTGIDGINDRAPVWLGRAVGSGNWADSLVEFVSAAQGSAQPNAVVNLSFDLTATGTDGSVTTRYELTGKERAALKNAQLHQVLIVAAAGNQAGQMSALGQASKEFDNIITVGAADGMNRAAYSGAGEGLDILAFGGTPERKAISTAGEGVGAAAGTSIAAAAVTGAASLVWAANPELSYRQVKEILLQTAADLNEPGWDALTGFGLLNLQAAVETAGGTVPEPLLREPVMESVPEPLLSFDLTATGEAVEGAKPSERPAFDRGDDYRIVSDSNSDNISYTSVIPSASLLFDGPSLSYTSEVPSFSPTSDIPIVISRSDDSESAGLINEPPRFISTNDIPIVISRSDDSESAGLINEPPRFISTNDIPIVISRSDDSESAGHTAVEHSDYIPSVSQTAISYSSVIPSVSQTAVSYSYEVPSISYSYEVPSVSYSYEVPSVSYSYEVPSISYSYEVPSVSYSYEVPSISYSYEVPSVSYSYEVPSVSYSYEVPSVSQTITSYVSTSFAVAGSTPSATYTSVSYSDNTPSVSQTITSNVSTSFAVAGSTPSATYTSVSYSDNTPSVSQTITSNVSTSFAGGTPSATYTSVSYSDNTSSVSSTYETSSAGDWSNTWEGDWSSESGDDGSQDSGYIDGNSYDTGYGDSYNYGWGYGGDYDYGSGYGGDYGYGSGYGGDYGYGSGYGGDYGYGSGYNGDYDYGSGYNGDYDYGSGYDGDYNYGWGYGGDYDYGWGYGGENSDSSYTSSTSSDGSHFIDGTLIVSSSDGSPQQNFINGLIKASERGRDAVLGFLKGLLYQYLKNNAALLQPAADLLNPEGVQARAKLEKLMQSNLAFQAGRGVADLAAILQGIVEITSGGGGTIAGGLSVNPPLIAAGVATAAHGLTTVGVSAQDLINLIGQVLQIRADGSPLDEVPDEDWEEFNNPRYGLSEEAIAIANGHAYTNHQLEFPEIKNREEFAELIDSIIKNPSEVKNLSMRRTAYWDERTETLVILAPGDADLGTAFRPDAGKQYFDSLR
jgi:hypothetical protein